jgi:Family of unknown function (DUF6256)
MSSSLVKSDLVPMIVGYVLVMGTLAVGLRIVRRGGRDAARGRRPAAGGGWRRLVASMAYTFTGGYLLLMAVIVAYYFGLVRFGGNFLDSAFSGCAELLGIAAPVFLALSWLDSRRKLGGARRAHRGQIADHRGEDEGI